MGLCNVTQVSVLLLQFENISKYNPEYDKPVQGKTVLYQKLRLKIRCGMYVWFYEIYLKYQNTISMILCLVVPRLGLKSFQKDCSKG